MEVILSRQTLSLVGMLERGLGYSIQQQRGKFYSKRNSKGFVPPDGHWRFIVLCAELAQNGLYISDIRVSREELKLAIYEAHGCVAVSHLRLNEYNARDVLNLKMTFGL